jgi:DNA mismatch endonuclease, patch repair protein
MPKTRRSFWTAKLLKNKRRDQKTLRKVRRAGWDVLVVWECQTREIERLAEKLAVFFGASSVGGNHF